MVPNVRAWFDSFAAAINGWPDYLLSLALVLSGIGIIGVGVFAPRWVKLIVAAWIWFP